MDRPTESWRAAWKELGVSEPYALLDSLIHRYSEPERSYHNVRHIGYCFDALTPAAHLAERLPEVQLALWFHDAIYDTHASDNEERSAALARENLAAAGVKAEAVEQIRGMIIATRHDHMGDAPDSRLVADVDLSILAAPRLRFDEYQAQIRQEYSWMPESEFHARRREILHGFLERSMIYQTAWFRERLEPAARANIMFALKTVPEPDPK